jgi:hypothetical protein
VVFSTPVMSSLYPISLRDSIDLAKPIGLTVDWEFSGDDQTGLIVAQTQAIQRFQAHISSGAFAPGPAAGVEAHESREPNQLRIFLNFYPCEPQSLRLLVCALQYQHCVLDSRAVINFSGDKARGRTASGAVLTTADLMKPLTALAAPFPIYAQWCYKYLTLELSFSSSPPADLQERLDDAVANWCVLGNLGAYAYSAELDAFDPDEQMQLLVDVPTIGEDFMTWSISQLNMPKQCLIPLFNMLQAADPLQSWICQMRIQ